MSNEADDRDHQVGGVELPTVAERLREDRTVDALALDQVADLIAGRAPPVQIAFTTIELGQFHESVERHPGHHLRVDEVARLAADLPDALVRLGPEIQHRATDPGEELPEDLVDVAVLLPVEPNRVEQLAEDVELKLGRSTVADPHRPRAAVALEVVELHFGEEALAADAVHDLKRLRS